MKEKKILFLKKSRLALYFVLLFLSLSPSNQIDAKVSIQNIKNMTDEEDEIKKLKLIAVGDNLIHSSVYKNGKKKWYL